jgi:hypothetical protein
MTFMMSSPCSSCARGLTRTLPPQAKVESARSQSVSPLSLAPSGQCQ